MIKVDNLVKEFPVKEGIKLAVDDVSFELAEGEFFTLLGPSGCGKTTILRMIAGLEKPTKGVISIAGRRVYENKVLVPANRRQLGMVFQSYAVWPHMTVFENVAFPLNVSKEKISKDEIKTRVNDVLALVDLGGLGDRMSTQLSGGQQQRLSVARALVRRPKVLLLDEPLSNLDAKLRERMRTELRIIQQQIGITTIFVTHDQIEALSMSDRIAVIHDGHIEQVGTPDEVYHYPATSFVAEFIGGANMFHGVVESIDGEGSAWIKTDLGRILGRALPGLEPGEKAIASIHLEDVELTTQPADELDRNNVREGKIVISLFNGPSVNYIVDIGDMDIEAQLGGHDAIPTGTDVRVIFAKRDIRILPDDTQHRMAHDSDDADDTFESKE